MFVRHTIFALSGICLRSQPSFSTRIRTMASGYNFETLLVTKLSEGVFEVKLNRPAKLNAMNKKFWFEMPECFDAIAEDKECRAVVIRGEGRAFTAGLDLSDSSMMQSLSGFSGDEDGEDDGPDVGRKAFSLRKTILKFQDSFNAIERCPKPVVAAVHGPCIGAGVDLITACDIRYCSRDAFFVVKEVDIGLAADVGTLQRLPRIVGNDSLVRELAYTARRLLADEAYRFGLVSKVLDDAEKVAEEARSLAADIASKSPIAVQGTKMNFVYSRDHTVVNGLHYMAAWNSVMLQSEDLMKAAVGSMTKETPEFKKL